jgi:hypothetical protein
MNKTMSGTIDFSQLHLNIPQEVYSVTTEKQQEIFEYLKNMDENDKKAYLIALDHLGSSFNIYRSNGFKDWKQTKK